MINFIPLLLIPLIFTFTFDYYTFNKANYKKDIEEENIISIQKDLKFNSLTINQLYSEKIIQNIEKNNIIKLKPKSKKKFVDKPELDNNYHFVSLEWQSNLSHKKINFIKTIIPLIISENNKIHIERKKLLEIKNILTFKKSLNSDNLNYINKVLKKYKISNKNKHKIDLVNELLLNINIIPNSIVLAQAANESGWGTSRFAIEYNALFGQYTYDKNKGIIPAQREVGKKHLIKNFTSIEKSVESYFKNINSHYAYQKFRKIRSEINDFENDFNIKILTNALDVYAEDEYYVETINKIIDSNNLNKLNIISIDLVNS